MSAGVLKCYATERGRNQIVDWYVREDPRVRAAFREFVDAIVQQPLIEWGPQLDVATLHGKWSALHKFKIRLPNIQLRPLGFFGPARNEYTILFVAREKDRDWVPKDAKDKALKRMNEVKLNPKQAVRYELSLFSK